MPSGCELTLTPPTNHILNPNPYPNQAGMPGLDAQTLRAFIVNWLQANGERLMDDIGAPGKRTVLRDLVSERDWAGYIREMGKHGVTWGDEATLLAASVLFKAEIVVISSLTEDYCHIVTPPEVIKPSTLHACMP